MSQNISPPSPRKKPVLPWILLGCGVLFAGFIALIVFIFFVVGSAMRSSDPYKTALQRAQNDPRVTAALGSPIKPGFFVQGSINTDANGTGNADLTVPISGPKGKGHLHVVGTKSGGTWSYSTMTVTPENAGPIDLLSSGSARTTHPAW